MRYPTTEMISAADMEQLRGWLDEFKRPATEIEWVMIAGILARIIRLQDMELARRGPRPIIDFVMPIITIFMALWVLFGANVSLC